MNIVHSKLCELVKLFIVISHWNNVGIILIPDDIYIYTNIYSDPGRIVFLGHQIADVKRAAGRQDTFISKQNHLHVKFTDDLVFSFTQTKPTTQFL